MLALSPLAANSRSSESRKSSSCLFPVYTHKKIDLGSNPSLLGPGSLGVCFCRGPRMGTLTVGGRQG
eukprot:8995968-Pyramimonas_sp.AAC.1